MASDKAISSLKEPGIHLIPTNKLSTPTGSRFGHFYVKAHGRLSSSSRNENWTIFLDGIFIHESPNTINDADYALELFLSKGIEAFQEVNGFFNILVISTSGDQVYFISDLLCSRAWYMYENKNIISVSSTPVTFSEIDLEMSISPQALYEQIRLLHTGSNRTLMQEVKRVLPGFSYKIVDGNKVELNRVTRFKQEIDSSLSLEDCAKLQTDICSNIVKGVLSHEKLKDLPVQLPLTGGLDSRHLLGELIQQDATPDLFCHVRIQEKDYKPVKKIAGELKIPLQAQTLSELNTGDLLLRWMNRSAGLVNIHQYYLFAVKNQISESSSISFNGYLMDLLMGMAVKTDSLTANNPHKPVWNRTYSSPTIRKLLISDEKHWESITEKLFVDEIENYEGEPWYRMLMLDLHHRGLHYTGIVDSMVSDEVFSFSPAASKDIYHFAARAPHNIAGDKKARLNALQKNFPEIASYPGVEGIPFSEMTIRKEIIEHPLKKNLKILAKAVGSGFKSGEKNESEHSWIRNHTELRTIHKTVVNNSELVKDGYLNSRGVKTSWFINEMGGYQGWTLMSILSAEIAYRILVKKQPPNKILKWLFESAK